MTQPSQIVIGNIRLQALSTSLLRIEVRGPKGFEDRPTFNVEYRDWRATGCRIAMDGTQTLFCTGYYRAIIIGKGDSLSDVRVETMDGDLIYQFNGEIPVIKELPSPSDRFSAWVMADNPRIIPPDWGALPPPDEMPYSATSGWDVDNDAPDLYLFIPGAGGYQQLREDLLMLTGSIPIPPLFIFGLTDSRYHPYSEKTALETIDTYRNKNIPLDVFVMDTDWRVGASHGYEINTELFPDMAGFLNKAHDRKVKVLFNDHPEPYKVGGLNPEELQYRYDNLTRILGLGADVWWYDRNWYTHIQPPIPGFVRDVWGQKLYHDITQNYHPEKRPLILSNVAGILHGYRVFPPHPAEHRYPVWWTGDTVARWDYLRRGIENSVDYGLIGLMPYVHEDLGGHFGNPIPELYVRFVQFGVFSPITRLHCTQGEVRFPWAFGEREAEIVSEYIRLRYRLLPEIYSAARCAFEDGTPILRRCDLEWPEYSEAADSSQYLFGNDFLVAPMNTGKDDFDRIEPTHFRKLDQDPGLLGEYFDGLVFDEALVNKKIDTLIDFDWGWTRLPEGANLSAFSIRWTGQLVDVSETGLYTIGFFLSGKVRLKLDQVIILEAESADVTKPVVASIELKAGKSYDLIIEFKKTELRAYIMLVWQLPSKKNVRPYRSVWLPPGTWMDAWRGERILGPKSIQVNPELWCTPIYLREGGLVFSLPQMQYTGEHSWETVIVDAIVPGSDLKVKRLLYEDDGISQAYLDGAYCKTEVLLQRAENRILIQISPIEGDFSDRITMRNWVLRLHLPKVTKFETIELNGRQLALINNTGSEAVPGVKLLSPGGTGKEMPFRGQGAQPGPDGGDVLEVCLSDWATEKTIIVTIFLYNI